MGMVFAYAYTMLNLKMLVETEAVPRHAREVPVTRTIFVPGFPKGNPCAEK